jgi:hypothetical protein
MPDLIDHILIQHRAMVDLLRETHQEMATLESLPSNVRQRIEGEPECETDHSLQEQSP